MFIYILVLLTCFSFVLTQEFGAPVPQPERVPQVLLQSVNNVGLFLNTFHDVNKIDGLEQIEQAMSKLITLGFKSEEDYQCLEDLTTWKTDVINNETYALTMRDSWASKQSGILEGNVRWSGHYYECINSKTSTFRGKYCSTFFGATFIPIWKGVPVDASFAQCFPSSCSSNAVKNIMRQVTADKSLPVLETVCPKVDYGLDGFGYAFITMFSLYLMMAVVGTIYDLVTIKRTKHKNDYNKIQKLTKCFSVIQNSKELLNTKDPPGSISCIHGIRVISTLWVILLHSYDFPRTRLDNSVPAGLAYTQGFMYMVATNGTFSVDTFFVVGGLLTAYLLIKRWNKNGKADNVLLLYLHRYIRLTPSCAILICFATGVWKYVGQGPTWAIYTETAKAMCENDWWTNLLYINDLYPSSNNCFPHTWYLSNDMQFYILAPIFVFLFWKNAIVGITACLLVMFGSIAIVTKVSHDYTAIPGALVTALHSKWFGQIYLLLGGFSSTTRDGPDSPYRSRFRYDTYYTPWSRISVYMIGMVAGFILFHFKKKVPINKVVAWIGWLLSIGVGMAVVFGIFPQQRDLFLPSIPMLTFFGSATRPAFGICVAWVIVACASGRGGPVKKFLSWGVFVSLSKLTFTAYLIHPAVIYWYYGTSDRMNHWTDITMCYAYIGHVILTFMFAFVLSCLVEWPTMKAAKLLIPSPQRRKLTNDSNNIKYSAKDLEQTTENAYKTYDLTSLKSEKNAYDNHSYYNEKTSL